ncbi:MAG: hypothetical protein ACKVW3_12310 [Phycisphaerales bacterium]
MRVFWALILLLAAGAGVMLFRKPSVPADVPATRGRGAAAAAPASASKPVSSEQAKPMPTETKATEATRPQESGAAEPKIVPPSAGAAASAASAPVSVAPPISEAQVPGTDNSRAKAAEPNAVVESGKAIPTGTQAVPKAEIPAPKIEPPAPKPVVPEGATPLAPVTPPASAPATPAPVTVPNAQDKPVPATPSAPGTSLSPAESPKTVGEPKPAVAEPKVAEGGAALPDGQAVAGDGPSPAASEMPEIERREDGSMLVEKKYVMHGKGTAEEPYKVTWDHLLSAQEDYVPREGRKKIPARIAMLHEKHVEVAGYVAFPLMADSADELLSMMNQWDGCCIGVPPTPYDAIEVRLAKVVEGKERQTTFGIVRGRLLVSPHLVGGWLVGLYVMDQATLKPEAFNGFAP